jgi:hypothetical protein
MFRANYNKKDNIIVYICCVVDQEIKGLLAGVAAVSIEGPKVRRKTETAKRVDNEYSFGENLEYFIFHEFGKDWIFPYWPHRLDESMR